MVLCARAEMSVRIVHNDTVCRGGEGEVGSAHRDGLTAAGSAPVVALLWLGRKENMCTMHIAQPSQDFIIL